METITKIFRGVCLFFFTLWISGKLYFLVCSNPTNSPQSIGGILIGIIFAVIRIILAIILFIPALIYGFVHSIFFSTDPKSDSVSMLYIIIPCAFLWFIFKILQGRNEAGKISPAKINKYNENNYKYISDYNYNSYNEFNKPKGSALKKPIIQNTLTSNYTTDDSDDDSVSSTNLDLVDEDTTSSNNTTTEAETDSENNDSENGGFGFRVLPADCQDCDYPGNGKCSDCHGSGYESNVFEAVAESLSGQGQICKTCHGTGKCQTCNGKGYLNG
jgi:hypothetical protein